MNKKGFGLTEMIVIIVALTICIAIVSIIYNQNFKALSEKKDLNDTEIKMTTKDNEEVENNKEVKSDKYIDLEDKIKNASKSYIEKNNLKTEKVIVTTQRLIENNYIKQLLDPKDETILCKGYVIYDGNDGYSPYLKCGSNYMTENYNNNLE